MIRYLLATTLLVVPCANAIAQAFAMDAFLWKHRPLIIFAPAADAPGPKSLRAAAGQAIADFQGRDMVLIEVYEDDTAALDGRALPAGTAADLRQRYGVSEEETTMILVGKDGGDKLRTSEIVDLEQIFSLIDTMPMRRQEMRQRP